MRYKSVHCLSHMEDADGICAASLVKQATGASIMLTDYNGVMDKLRKIANQDNIKELYVCDLGTNKSVQDEFVDLLEKMTTKETRVTYIDHHQIDENIKTRLNKSKVTFIYDTNECATILVHDLLKDKLSDHADFTAACAALTDYMETSPKATPLMEKYDRQFILVNATMLTYYITGKQEYMQRLIELAHELAKDAYPCNISNLFTDARQQIQKTSKMVEYVDKNLKTENNLSHVYIEGDSSAGAVNFALGASRKNVALSFRDIENNSYAVSIRGKNIQYNLGKIVGELAYKYGGLGGGHALVCGASVPKNNMKLFIQDFDEMIPKPTEFINTHY